MFYRGPKPSFRNICTNRILSDLEDIMEYQSTDKVMVHPSGLSHHYSLYESFFEFLYLRKVDLFDVFPTSDDDFDVDIMEDIRWGILDWLEYSHLIDREGVHNV